MNTQRQNLLCLLYTTFLACGPGKLNDVKTLFPPILAIFLFVDAWLLSNNSNGTLLQMFALGAIKTSIYAGVIFLWLRSLSKADRFLATFTALIAMNIIAQILKLPLFPLPPEPGAVIPVIMMTTLFWQLVVSVYILKQATEKSSFETGFVFLMTNLVAYSVATSVVTLITGAPIKIG